MKKFLTGIFDKYHKRIQEVSDNTTPQLKVYGQTESDNNEIGNIVYELGIGGLWSQPLQAWIFADSDVSTLKKIQDKLETEFDLLGITAITEIE
jgi:hypothetical protein